MKQKWEKKKRNIGSERNYFSNMNIFLSGSRSWVCRSICFTRTTRSNPSHAKSAWMSWRSQSLCRCAVIISVVLVWTGGSKYKAKTTPLRKLNVQSAASSAHPNLHRRPSWRKSRRCPPNTGITLLGATNVFCMGTSHRTRDTDQRPMPCPRECGVIVTASSAATHLLTCDKNGDALTASLMCYDCRFRYLQGDRPEHCNYYRLASKIRRDFW